MAQPNSTLTFIDLKKHVARLKYSAHTDTEYSALSSDQKAELADIVNVALLDFLGENDWPFMTPTSTFTLWATRTGTTSGVPTTTVTSAAAMFYPSMIGKTLRFTSSGRTYTITAYTSSTVVTVSSTAAAEGNGAAMSVTADGDYTLPDDFGGITGRLTYEPDTLSLQLRPRASHEIDSLRNQDSSTSTYSTDYAIGSIEFADAAGQRYMLRVWPTPSTTYNIYMRRAIVPGKLDTDAEHVPGGTLFSPVIRDACLAENEIRTGGLDGPLYMRYRGRDEAGNLLASCSLAKAIRIAARFKPGVSGGQSVSRPPYNVALLDTSGLGPT